MEKGWWELPSGSSFGGPNEPPRPPKIKEAVVSGVFAGIIRCRGVCVLPNGIPSEDCLTTEEWFELAHDAETHCRVHWGPFAVI